MTLLEKAASVDKGQFKPLNRDFPQQEIELALGWVAEEVTASQVAAVLDRGRNRSPGRLASWLMPRIRAAYRLGYLKPAQKRKAA